MTSPAPSPTGTWPHPPMPRTLFRSDWLLVPLSLLLGARLQPAPGWSRLLAAQARARHHRSSPCRSILVAQWHRRPDLIDSGSGDIALYDSVHQTTSNSRHYQTIAQSALAGMDPVHRLDAEVNQLPARWQTSWSDLSRTDGSDWGAGRRTDLLGAYEGIGADAHRLRTLGGVSQGQAGHAQHCRLLGDAAGIDITALACLTR